MAETSEARLIALDTNVLVDLFRGGSTGRHVEQKLAARVAAGAAAAIPVFCIGEFWRAVTRENDPLRASAAVAQRFLDEWIESAGRVLMPGEGYWPTMRELMEFRPPSSNQIFDLQILAVCIEYGVQEIWTMDSGFPMWGGVEVVDPLLDMR